MLSKLKFGTSVRLPLKRHRSLGALYGVFPYATTPRGISVAPRLCASVHANLALVEVCVNNAKLVKTKLEDTQTTFGPLVGLFFSMIGLSLVSNEHPRSQEVPSDKVGISTNERNGADTAGKDVDKMPNMMLFCGNANPELAGEIASMLRKELGDIKVSRFADGEVNVAVGENVRGKDVFIIQPTCTPVNEHLMELLLMVSTFRRASADKITAVIPYYGYARQDRKMTARVPISAADTARLLESMGVDRVIAVDLHCGQIQGFFGPRVPVDNLDGGTVGVSYFSQKELVNPVIISPDAGGVYRAKQFREGLNSLANVDAGLAMIIKQRPKAGQIERMDLVGSVEGSDCIIVDDMIDTAGTLCSAADMLKAHGARRVYAYAAHGLFSGPANERISRSSLQEVVVVNTVPLNTSAKTNPKISQLSVAQLLAETIQRVHKKKSVSALFKEKPRSNWHSTQERIVP